MRWGFVAVLVVGVLVRLETYLDNPSMWLDEVGLAISFLDIGYADLLAPLPEIKQQSPPLFNLVALIFTQTLGTGEHAFRLIPLAASLLSLPLFALLAGRLLRPRGALIALALFAGTPLTIRYAAEFKPYATDALVTVLLLFLALAIRRSGFSRRTCALAALTGVLFVWGSYTAIFVLAGVGVALLIEAMASDPPERAARVANTVAMGVVWLIGFGSFWFLVARHSAADLFYEYWADAFAPLPIDVEGVKWYVDAATDVMRSPVGWAFAKKPGILLLITGSALLLRRHRFAGMLVLAPFGFLWLASWLGQYPFSGRLIFFTLPLLLLAMGEGGDRLVGALTGNPRGGVPFRDRATPARSAGPIGRGPAGTTVALVFLAALLYQPARTVQSELTNRFEREETRALMAYYRDNVRGGDTTYCYRHAWKAFRYYSRHADAECRIGLPGRWEPQRAAVELDPLRGEGRVWLLFSHVQRDEEERYFLPWLDAHGVRLEAHHTEGASLYLYDL